MNELIVIGIIVKPQGIKGEVKIKPFTDDVRRFCTIKRFYIGEKEFFVEKARSNKDDVFIKFDKINDRNEAELFRKKNLLIPKDEIEKPKGDKYLILDLINSSIYVKDNCIGTLSEILQNGSADVYVVKQENSKKTIMFPALKDLILDIDIENRKITLDEKRFNEVAVYED